MIGTLWRIALTAVGAALLAGTAAAQVSSPPLKEVVREGVRDCGRAGRTLEVPIITWGADLVTIMGNGNKDRTANGSIFKDMGLDLRLKRQDDFVKQVEAYLSCSSPFLRATAGMANLASDLTEADPRTNMVAIYQHSWSAGGDALVVKEGIARPADLRGKKIAVQRYGPHVDYALKILSDAGLSQGDVELVWTEDLVGIAGSAPGALFASRNDIAAAFVIIPDGLALTSGGTVGTGAEGSVRGAEILLSTKSANRIIADQYFVRQDFYNANRGVVENFVQGLLIAEEVTSEIMGFGAAGGRDYTDLIASGGKLLLDDQGAVEDTEGLWADAETVGFSGNNRFYADAGFLRSFDRLNQEVQRSLLDWGLLKSTHVLAKANWDWAIFGGELSNADIAVVERFDTEAASEAITRFQASGAIDNETLFEFEINFEPNQTNFPVSLYQTSFEKVLALASTYAGAVISVEGHSDPLKYLRAVKDNEAEWKLRRLRTSTRNLSLGRAQSVRNAIVELAEGTSIVMDSSQFVTIGLGIDDPKTGQCGDLPCVPETEGQWRSNMRVVFRVVSMEAEDNVFRPL